MQIFDKIRERRQELGWSQNNLAKRIGVTQAAINKIENGQTRKSRFVAQILAALDLPQSLVLPSETVVREHYFGPGKVQDANLNVISIAVSGLAKAGEFLSVEELEEFDQRQSFHDIRDARFPDARHLAFEVGGDSMNALKPRPILAGDRVSALAYADISDRLPLRDGMIVVLERLRHDGSEREWSVKQLELYADRVEFHPRSTNSRHRPIILKYNDAGGGGTSANIIAIARRLVAEFEF